MRLMERRGWILLVLLVMTLAFTYLHIDKTVHINLSKPSQIVRAKATMEEKRENRKIAKQYAWVAFGWRGREWVCLESLWTRESRFDHYAQNPESSAFGIAQLLGERSRDPRIQILRGLRYIDGRYRTPCKAYKFALTHKHY
jgi:hypothetical protein